MGASTDSYEADQYHKISSGEDVLRIRRNLIRFYGDKCYYLSPVAYLDSQTWEWKMKRIIINKIKII